MELLVFEHCGRFEIVTEAEGVAYFVHGDLFDRLLDQFFGKLFPGFELITIKHAKGRHAELKLDVGATLTIAMAGGQVGRFEALGRFVPTWTGLGGCLEI